jgi:hypothetical protein
MAPKFVKLNCYVAIADWSKQDVMFTACFDERVNNETIVDRSTIEWVQYACVSTVKFHWVHFIKRFLLNIYGIHLSSFGFKVHSNNR